MAGYVERLSLARREWRPTAGTHSRGAQSDCSRQMLPEHLRLNAIIVGQPGKSR